LRLYISIYIRIAYAPSRASLRRLLTYIYTGNYTRHTLKYTNTQTHTHTHTHYILCVRVGESACHEYLCVYIISRVYLYMHIIHTIVYTANLRRHAHRARNSLNQFDGGSCRPHDCCAWDIEFVLLLSCRLHAYIFLHTQGELWQCGLVRDGFTRGPGVARRGLSGKNPRRSGRRGWNPARTRVRSFRLKPAPQQVDTSGTYLAYHIIYSQS